MELTLPDLARLLNVSRRTIYRWIEEQRIPVYKINRQYRFEESEIRTWLDSRRVSPDNGHHSAVLLNHETVQLPVRLFQLLKAGGIYYKIEGVTPVETIAHSIEVIAFPPALDRRRFVEAVLDRERLHTTAVGDGIAVPHVRTPFAVQPERCGLNICFLEQPVDFGAWDDLPVRTLFISLPESLRMHLAVMSRLSFLCRSPTFLSLLDRQAGRKELLEYVDAWESPQAVSDI